MKISGCRLRRQIAVGLAIVLTITLAQAAAPPPQQDLTGQETQSVRPAQSDSQAAGSQTGKENANTSWQSETIPDSPVPVESQAANQSERSATSLSGLERQQGGSPKPVGSAAAPYERTTGVAASRPAGAVIAPGKQRRARSILIRVGIVVGAAVAVGTVVALSHGSSSQPN